MEIIEKIKTNKSIDNQTEIQKICLDKLQSSPLPNPRSEPVSYTHLRAHETRHDLVCRLLLEKKGYEWTDNFIKET